MNKSGKTIYVYPDPAKNQIYVGNQAQYNAFKAARGAQARASVTADEGPDITLPTMSGVAVQIYDGWVPFDEM